MLTSLLLYIVAGWVMPDFFSGSLEGQRPYYFGLLLLAFRSKAGGDFSPYSCLSFHFRKCADFRLPVSGWDKALGEFLLSSRFAPFLCDSGGACVCVFHFPTAGRFPDGFAFYCQLSRSLHLYICACEGTPSLSLWLRVECFILVSRHRRCKQ